MKPGCGKCFKVAERNGNEYICPSCGDVVAQIPMTLSVEEENELLKKVAESYVRIINDLEEDCERYFDQRNRLIEGLRKLAKTNAENISEIREWKAKQNDPEVTDLDWYNYVARDILKECGVTVE